MAGPNEFISSGLRLGLVVGLGAAFGAPGYIIGGVLGTILFPPEGPEAPDPYTDLFLNTSNEFIPVPLLYGINKTPGNFIYMGSLRSQKIEEGGKGGQKTVVGHKYWGNWAIGVGKGTLDTTRMWKANDLFVHEGNTSVEIHRGTPEQTVDPDWDGFVDQAVPLRNFAYEMYVDHYLGKDNKTPPPLYRETHKFPFTDDLDTSPYVYNKVREDLTDGGVILRDKWDFTYIIDIETDEEMNVYNPDGSLARTVDLSPLLITDEWDATLTYNNGRAWINLYYIKPGTVSKDRIVVTRWVSSLPNIGLSASSKNIFTGTLVDNQFASNLNVTSNEDFIFVGATWQGTGQVFKTASGAPSSILATIDINSQSTSPDDMACNYEHFFVIDGATIYMYDLDGVYKDSEATGFGGTQHSIVCLYGGPHIIAYQFGDDLGGSVWEDRIFFASYDRSTELFITQSVPDLITDGYWASDSTPFREASIVKSSLYEGPDGTVLISAEQGGVAYSMILLVDANPAQVIYDALVNVRLLPVARITLADLETYGERCVANRIGIFMALAKKKSSGALIKNILGHCGGQVYRDGAGAFSFYLPLSTDASEGSITEADVLASKNGGSFNFEIINTSLKDIEICPNRLNVRYTNRLNGYKRDATAQIDDMLSIAEDGDIVDEDVHLNMFSNEAIVQSLGWRAWKNGRLNNKMHQIDLDGRWLWVRPGMVFTLDMPTKGFNGDRVRVFSVDDPALDSDAFITVSFQMDDSYLNSFERIDFQGSQSASTSIMPPGDVIPIVWEEDALQNGGTPSLGITLLRDTDDTASVDIFISEDTDDNYVYFDSVDSFGDLADIASALAEGDTEATVNTDPYPDSTFAAFTLTNQRNNFSRCLIGTQVTDEAQLDDFEVLSYRDVRTSGADLILEDLARGKDYTLPIAHATSEICVLVGRSYARKIITPENVGKTWYIKCVPTNAAGLQVDDLTSVTAYEYIIKGYAVKGTHVSGLELYQNGAGLGNLQTVDANDVVVQFAESYRLGGWARGASSQYRFGTFDPGDVTHYDALIYNSGGTLIATHLSITTAAVGERLQYSYTAVQNAIDFGVLTKSLFIGIRANTPLGSVGEEADFIVKIPVVINT